ncbi:hypothetical protein OG394_15820 [Kribbella sp. NBC_01245]|uniref:hypothetical protein n=1 Tax=Kribbella sp. NBC_01245 TaxID=2903578 RepID=UPI002E2DFC05|nr:hypothetical protein [Kribbella sp. NBC_01245]
MPNTGNARLDAAVGDVAAAFAEWIGSVEAVSAEIRPRRSLPRAVTPTDPRPPPG